MTENQIGDRYEFLRKYFGYAFRSRSDIRTKELTPPETWAIPKTFKLISGLKYMQFMFQHGMKIRT